MHRRPRSVVESKDLAGVYNYVTPIQETQCKTAASQNKRIGRLQSNILNQVLVSLPGLRFRRSTFAQVGHQLGREGSQVDGETAQGVPRGGRREDVRVERQGGRHPFSKTCLQHSQTVIQPCLWFKEEPSQFSLGQTAPSLTCFIMARDHIQGLGSGRVL